MAIDPRKRQKKLERRKAKQKAERRELARRDAGGLAMLFQRASSAPIVHCCAADDVWRQGIGQVLVSQQSALGQVAFVSFLVDIYCLGVKDLVMSVAPRAIYLRDMYERLAARSKLIPMQPQCARKLVEGAVEYARNLGLAPHADYRTAKLIFGDVSAADCRQQYTYGKDGKPRFIAGPYDSLARCQHVIRTLEAHCGPDGYHYIVPVDEEAILPSLGEGDWGRIDAGTDRVVPPRIRFDEVREDS